ncbi:hypothetical protein BCR34DRAFT_134055 [Clohesyomyces aquaticus]|uniref:Uncharacterized protein n=1 Tax=Clohesyomyces aquaticus TaxID=1231657 RepID=A0A1Y2AAQ7_9PLEO|nr:hypothetical protein BCR34DRAFT_134055 [Clohesyomyces aquaticus]
MPSSLRESLLKKMGRHRRQTLEKESKIARAVLAVGLGAIIKPIDEDMSDMAPNEIIATENTDMNPPNSSHGNDEFSLLPPNTQDMAALEDLVAHRSIDDIKQELHADDVLSRSAPAIPFLHHIVTAPSTVSVSIRNNQSRDAEPWSLRQPQHSMLTGPSCTSLPEPPLTGRRSLNSEPQHSADKVRRGRKRRSLSQSWSHSRTSSFTDPSQELGRRSPEISPAGSHPSRSFLTGPAHSDPLQLTDRPGEGVGEESLETSIAGLGAGLNYDSEAVESDAVESGSEDDDSSPTGSLFVRSLSISTVTGSTGT